MQSFLTRRQSNPVRVRGQTSTLDLPVAVSCAVHLAENYGNNNFRAIPRRPHFPVSSPVGPGRNFVSCVAVTGLQR